MAANNPNTFLAVAIDTYLQKMNHAFGSHLLDTLCETIKQETMAMVGLLELHLNGQYQVFPNFGGLEHVAPGGSTINTSSQRREYLFNRFEEFRSKWAGRNLTQTNIEAIGWILGRMYFSARFYVSPLGRAGRQPLVAHRN